MMKTRSVDSPGFEVGNEGGPGRGNKTDRQNDEQFTEPQSAGDKVAKLAGVSKRTAEREGRLNEKIKQHNIPSGTPRKKAGFEEGNEANSKGVNQYNRTRGQNDHAGKTAETAKKIAEQVGKSEKTVRRYDKEVEAVEKAGKTTAFHPLQMTQFDYYCIDKSAECVYSGEHGNGIHKLFMPPNSKGVGHQPHIGEFTRQGRELAGH